MELTNVGGRKAAIGRLVVTFGAEGRLRQSPASGRDCEGSSGLVESSSLGSCYRVKASPIPLKRRISAIRGTTSREYGSWGCYHRR